MLRYLLRMPAQLQAVEKEGTDVTTAVVDREPFDRLGIFRGQGGI